MNILSFSKFYRNFIFLIFTMSTLFGLSSCSAGNSDSQTDSMADTSVSQTHNHQSGGHYMGSSYDRVKQEVRDITIFGVKTTSQELEAAKDLAKAGILNIDTIHEKDGKFTGAVVEFAGVKFGMNRGFIFITSRHDKAAVKPLVKTTIFVLYLGLSQCPIHPYSPSSFRRGWTDHAVGHLITAEYRFGRQFGPVG